LFPQKRVLKSLLLFRQSQRFFYSTNRAVSKAFFSDVSRKTRSSSQEKLGTKLRKSTTKNISAHSYCSCVEHGIDAALAVIYHQATKLSPVLKPRFRNSTILPLRNCFQIQIVYCRPHITIRPEQNFLKSIMSLIRIAK
jgi:hypothetical protein